MNKDKKASHFQNTRITSLQRQLQECQKISKARQTKNFNLITEIKKLRKLIATYRIGKSNND